MTAVDVKSQRCLEDLDDAREELVDLTRMLVKIPTLNPPGEYYRDICEAISDYLKPAGFVVKLIRAHGALGDSDEYPRWNLIARHEGRSKGDCVHFNSHIDVVDAGRGWTKDPFGASVENDRIYGRGTCDMKGGLASSIVAATHFINRFPEYSGAIEISATADEESGGYGGVAYLAEQGWFSADRVQHVVIPEPLNKDRICLGHRGVWWAEIEAFGSIAHGSMPFLGDCAIRHMGAVLEEIESSLYPMLGERTTAMPVVPEQARQSTLNINSLHGGQAEPPGGYTGWPSPLVPDSCRMVFDRRFLLEEDIATVKQEMRDILDAVKKKRSTFNYTLMDMHEVLPTMTDRSAPVVTSVSAAIESVLGRRPDYVVSPGTYDQKHIDRIGRMKNCIAYGPGILELAHQPDEYIEIEDMVDSSKVMALALIDLLLR